MPKWEKSTDHGHKLISSEDGQDTSACKISGHSLHAFSGKCPETSPDGRTDRHAVKRLRLVGWTNGPMYRSKEGILGFGRTDGRTDRQPENIMPPAPKSTLFRLWVGAWLNTLWPSDTIWRHRSGSTLAQVMACCLTAPSHYLNQCWPIISKVELHSSKGKFIRDTSAIKHWYYLEN